MCLCGHVSGVSSPLLRWPASPSRGKGGGTVFGPEPHTYVKKTTKKMRRLARRSVLSDKVKSGNFFVVDDISLEEPKTKLLVKLLSSLDLSDRKITLLVDSEKDNLFLAARNIPNVEVITVREINPINLLKPQKVAATSEALKQIEDWING